MTSRNSKKRRKPRAAVVVLWLLCAVCAGALAALCWHMFAPQTPAESTALPASTVSAQPTPQPQPQVTQLRVSATGDNLIHDGLYLQAQKRAGGSGYDFTALYEHVAPFYQGFDINWINQETLVTDEFPPSSYPMFCTPAALGQHMYDIGMRVVAMSNNHAYDKGAEGIAATRRFWASMPDDVVTTGLWEGEADYDRIPIQEQDGVKIAWLAYTESTNGLPPPQGAEANIIYTSQEDVIQHQIELARQQADVVAVGVHWGTENSHVVNDAQRALAQKMADWGADIIIGTHPHVVQAIETLASADGRQVPVAYSLGNFVSTQVQADNLIGIILTFDITKTTQPDGASQTVVDHVKAVPVVMHYDAGFANARVYLLQDYTDELAAAHGCHANNAVFTRAYIEQVLQENISEEYLQLG